MSPAAACLPCTGVPYNLFVTRGLSSDRKLLSCPDNGGKADLWHCDDGSYRQKWLLTALPDGSYNITVLGGVCGGRKFLSCTADGELVDLWFKDDGSGRQRWRLEPLPNGCVRIRVAGGVEGGRRFLSCTHDGRVVDLWHCDDESGRQQWALVPEDVQLAEVDFRLGMGRTDALPDFVTEMTVTNDTQVEQSMTIEFAQRASTSSSFEKTSGYDFTSSIELGIPKLLTTGSLSVSYSESWKYGSQEARRDSRSYSLPVKVPPRTRVVAKAVVTQSKLDVPYKGTGYSKLTGQRVTCEGVWRGVSLGEVKYRIEESPL